MRNALRWTGGPLWAVLAVVGLSGVGLLVLFGPGDRWTGSWKMALDQGTGTVVLIGPATAGLAAWCYARMRELSWDRWLAGVRRGLLGWLAPLVTVGLIGLAATTACTVVAVVLAQRAGASPVPHELGTFGQVAAVIGCQATTGALIGARLRTVAAAPTAVVSTLLLEVVTSPAHVGDVYRTGGVTGPLAAETFDLGTLARESLLLVLATGVLVLLLTRSVTPRLGRSRSVLLGAGAVAVLAGWLALNSYGFERYRPVAGEPTMSCRGHAPAVCTSTDTVRPLAALRSGLARQSRALERAGAVLPDRFVQDLPGRAPAEDGLIIMTTEEVLGEKVSAMSVAISLATPHACPGFTSDRVPGRALEVKSILVDWIADHGSPTARVMPGTSAEGRWLSRPFAEQAAWVRDTYALLTSCALDRLTLPFDE